MKRVTGVSKCAQTCEKSQLRVADGHIGSEVEELVHFIKQRCIKKLT